MSAEITQYLLGILYSLPAILISLSVHELCHGFAAYKLGDPTAKMMGRLSLNPLRHIDPIGFIALLFFRFGWAKPVMVDSRYLKHPKRDMAIISLAGPLSNFLLAFLSSFLYVLLARYALRSQIMYIIFQMVMYLFLINIGLGIFNLIPIPPLDGSKILYSFLPNRIIYKIQPYERYIQLVLILLLLLGALDGIIGTAQMALSSFFLRIASEVLG